MVSCKLVNSNFISSTKCTTQGLHNNDRFVVFGFDVNIYYRSRFYSIKLLCSWWQLVWRIHSRLKHNLREKGKNSLFFEVMENAMFSCTLEQKALTYYTSILNLSQPCFAVPAKATELYLDARRTIEDYVKVIFYWDENSLLSNVFSWNCGYINSMLEILQVFKIIA